MEYDYWLKEKKDTEHKLNCLNYEDFTKELSNIYSRKIEIFEDILGDLAPQLDDDQYEGVTSWGYEDELKKLNERLEKLEPEVEEERARRENQAMLDDMGMTQEQYDAWDREQNEIQRQNRLARFRRGKN